MDIVLVEAEEWQGLYIDGKLVDQDHSIPISTLVRVLRGTVTHLNSDQDNLLCASGNLPNTLQEFIEKYGPLKK